ncbi:hypothetical protein DFA_03638 [Cavenderia fasciculata]|uniref:E3 UFM1-protein ligase 1 homolog n=1 Tax=Cavenderia fasciculata TaxID=261658 RepID=F4PIG0_CACFS|nr:uncharacterized protein DFA_03638 [Cavenderia fasciculata]EGG25389.1 hypothetical protein DFA_03638 [Cavenderia fasciculata]|eukprot:XP_004363240.1 hypothetical protein DFA_03638 [Cavenderia fasciculata]
MEELEALRQRLSNIQKSQSAQRLSERNCIEIIVKMLELKMIDLIHTSTGREYITPKQLELEINDEILSHGGRVAITDLQSIIGVDMKYIQDTVDIIQKKDRSISIVYGDIVTKYYMDSIMDEINETLQVNGRLHISDLSQRFSLNYDILIEGINSRLGKRIHGIFENNVTLYTNDIIDRHKARVRGLFTALTKPTLINSLCKQYQMNDKLFVPQLNELIAQKRISGVVQGKGTQSVFIPTSFSVNRSKWIESFYKQNSYVSFSTLSNFQIVDPQTYLKNLFDDGTLLSSCIISNHIVNGIEESIRESITTSGWFDVTTLIPSILNNKDISVLISSCPSMKEKDTQVTILNENYVVSNSFIERAYSLLETMIQQKVQKQLILQESMATSQSSLATSIDGQNKPNSSKQKGGKGKQQVDIDDQQDIKPTKSGGKPTKKGGKKKRDDSDDEDYNAPQQKSKNNKKPSQLDHLPDMIQILKSFESMEGELTQHLGLYLRPRINQMWDSLVKEAKDKLENETNKTRKVKQSELAAHFTTQYLNLQLFKKGLDDLEGPNTILHKHLLKSICNNITNIIVETNASFHTLENTNCDTPAQRSVILSQLPPHVTKQLEKLVQSLTKSSITEFIDNLENVCNLCQIHLKSLDKKTEKTLLETHQQSLWEELDDNNQDIGAQYHAIVLLTYIKYKKRLVHAPPRSIPTLLESLSQEKIERGFMELLESTHKQVVDHIKEESSAIPIETIKQNVNNLISQLNPPHSLSPLSSTTTTSTTSTVSND